MKIAEVLAIITEANHELMSNKVKDINYGGCGIFAEKFYNILIKLGQKPKIVILTDEPCGYHNQVKDNNYYSVICNHVVVKIGKCYYDSNGKFNPKKEYTHCQLIQGVPLDVLRKFNGLTETTSIYHIWNRRFDRSQIPVIEQTLEKVYEKYVNNLVVSNI